VFREEACEISEWFELAIAGFLMGNFFDFSLGIILFHAEDSTIFYSAYFKLGLS
jgi:hypothetical protein